MDKLISLQEAIKAIDEKAKRIKNEDTLNGLAGAVGILFDLPSVKPQYTDDEIQAMQDLEQAEIQKAYELGKAERGHGHWIWQTEDIYRCSECGEDIHVKEVMNVPQYEWCPMCGAKMVEPQESEE